MDDFALLEVIERLMLTGLTHEDACHLIAKVIEENIEFYLTLDNPNHMSQIYFVVDINNGLALLLFSTILSGSVAS